jgi:peptide/nickel transport system permease protein
MTAPGTQAEIELAVDDARRPDVAPALVPPLQESPDERPAAAMSQWQLIRRRFAKHKLAVASLYVLTLLYLMAAFAEVVAPYTPNRRNIDFSYCPPQLPRFNFTHGLHTYAMKLHVDPITFRRTYVELRDAPIRLRLFAKSDAYRLWGLVPLNVHLVAPARDVLQNVEGVQPTFYLLGADKYGRDIFSRIVYGARVSLSVGLIGIAFTFLLGTTLGGVSGYVGGRTDTLIQRTIEIINAFPHLPLWLALAAVLPSDWSPIRIYFAITILLSLLNWTGLARVVRGKILALREEDYAVAARLLGAGHGRVLFRHLMPGFTSHIIVALTLSIPGMILGETSLSFLGLGLRPPVVSWGVMLQDCMDVKAVSIYPWLLIPVSFIVTTVLCFNFLGDGLRDAADPYGSR